ncbi:MAG: thioredoxin [Planctomycetota bacterium]|nr:MAG: thioredoxin [Planctomycetota bacterium]
MPHAGNNSAVTQATDDSFADIVDKNSGTVLVDFYADWCGPCQVQRGVLEEYAAEHSNVHVVRVNVDESPTLAQMYLIDSIPDLKVFRDGRLVTEHVGLADGVTIDALLLEAE